MRNIYFVVNSYHKYCTCKETIINTLYCFRKKSVKIAYIIASYLCQNQQFHQCQRFSGAKSDLVLQSWFRSNSNSSTAVTLAIIHNHFKWVIIVIIALVWASTEIPDFRKQLRIVLDKYLNSLLCGFRKAHSSQHALFKLLQAWQEELDKSGFVGTIIMDLSKAYDSLPHYMIKMD